MSDASRILAVEMSGRRGSLALAAGGRVLDEVGFASDRERARDLLPCADELVRKHGWSPPDLNEIHVSIGPGSFTGLRVAVTFARHMALAIGAKLGSVPTLDVIAANALTVDVLPACVVPMLDAKKDQVFAAAYSLAGGRYDCIVPACMVEPVAFVEKIQRMGGGSPCFVVGEGLKNHRDKLEGLASDGRVEIGHENLWWPHASRVIEIGRRLVERDGYTQANLMVPDYVRRPEAEEIWEKRFGK